jgi:hypothetical protein
MDKFQGFPDVDPHGNPIYTLNVADVFTRPSSFKLSAFSFRFALLPPSSR